MELTKQERSGTLRKTWSGLCEQLDSRTWDFLSKEITHANTVLYPDKLSSVQTVFDMRLLHELGKRSISENTSLMTGLSRRLLPA